MPDEVARFWIPMASILPVFILGLVIEARVSVPAIKVDKLVPRSPRWKSMATFMTVIDRISVIGYALIYVGAMALLVLAFVSCVLVLAGDEPPESGVGFVLVVSILGVAFTGLLPVSRLLRPVWKEHAEAPFLKRVFVSQRARNVRRLNKIV